MISGGVCLNDIIIDEIYKEMEKLNCNFFTNTKVSPGDGGVSIGQAYLLALNKLGFSD